MSATQGIDLFREAFPEAFDGKPARLQVFKTGSWSHPQYGPINITRADLDTIVKNYETTGRAVVIDYDHGTDTGTKPEERKAAGWVKDLRVEGEGDNASLWADVGLTDEAAGYVQKGEYRFVSPTWVSSFANKETGEEQGITLLRAAITNNPFIDGMHPAVPLSERAGEMLATPKREAPTQEVKAVTQAGCAVWLATERGLSLKTEVVSV